MRTFLAIIGGFTVVAVIIVAALFVIGINKLKPLTAEATAFADAAIPAIGAEWEKDEFRARATPELLSVLSNGGLDNLMSAGKRSLGAIVAYDGATCLVTDFQITTQQGELVNAECKASATFERSRADFTLGLLKRDDEWKFLQFYIELPAASSSTMVSHQPEAPDTEQPFQISFTPTSVALTRAPQSGAGAGLETPEDKLKNLD